MNNENPHTQDSVAHPDQKRPDTAPSYDVLIVGAGLFGLTMAERLTNELGKRVLLIDQRNHLGGNCYSEFDSETGIECHKYGAHLFHTSLPAVWNYVNRFTKFTNYVHHVYTTHDGVVYPLPINLGTINQFFQAAYTPDEARLKIADQAAKYYLKSASSNLKSEEQTSENPNAVKSQAANPETDNDLNDHRPKNLVEQGISLIGEPLFNAFIKNYTAKQWQTPAEDLSPDIIKRLPVRYNYDNRYFNDTYEGLPVDGYAAWFDSMVKSCGDNLEIRLETNYFDDPELQKLKDSGILTIYTGPIDRFYDYQFGELKWRSLDFAKAVLDVDDFQGCPVMNYADLEPQYTRIHEFKHFHPERTNNPAFANTAYAPASGKTVIVREYSKTWELGEELYYPVNTAGDRQKLAEYQSLAAQEDNIIFGGRLGEYAYYDMDKTIAAALAKYEELKSRLN